MHVEFVAYGPVREIVGAKETAVELPPGTTLRGLFEALATDYPELEGVVFDGNGVTGSVSVTVNGEAIGRVGGLEAVLVDGDVVRVAPAIHGG